MIRFLAILLCLSVFLPALSASAEEVPAWKQDGVLRIFGIGNSYTEDTLYEVDEVARYLGIENVELGFLYIGGCTISQHLSNLDGDKAAYTLFSNTAGYWQTRNNVSISEGLALDDWDFVLIQESSRLSGGPQYLGDAERLAKSVRAMKPQAKLVWNMVWSYPDEQTVFPEFAAYYNKDNQVMYDGIVATTQERIVPIEEIDLIIPNATAIQNARQSYLGDYHYRLFRDKLHLTYTEGRNIVAMNTLATLIGADVSSMQGFFQDEKLAAIAIESVLNAQASPFATTPTSYPTTVDRKAMKNRYAIQCDTFYADDGGWMVNAKKEYIWLKRSESALKYGVVFNADGEKGAEIALTLQDSGESELLYMMTAPVALPETVMIGCTRLQVYIPDGFGGSITLTLASGQTFSLQNSVAWTLNAADLAPGWNELSLAFDDAQESGYFDSKNFKLVQIIVNGAAGDAVRLADICLDGN